jgi:hypothetical protein
MQKIGVIGFLLFFSIHALAKLPCAGQAYINDKDPKGTNVRAEPSIQAKVIHVIPHDEDGVIVTLSESHDGWIQISGYETIAGAKKKLNGWVNAKLLGTGNRAVEGTGRVLYEAPNKSSKTRSLAPLGDLNEIGYRLLGCDRDWLYVEQDYPPSKTPFSGWIPGDAHCPNPVTTCP